MIFTPTRQRFLFTQMHAPYTYSYVQVFIKAVGIRQVSLTSSKLPKIEKLPTAQCCTHRSSLWHGHCCVLWGDICDTRISGFSKNSCLETLSQSPLSTELPICAPPAELHTDIPGLWEPWGQRGTPQGPRSLRSSKLKSRNLSNNTSLSLLGCYTTR